MADISKFDDISKLQTYEDYIANNITDMINCHNCNNCTYIGEGDYICDMTTEVVISEWQPTEDYYSCEGKDFENI